MPGTQTLSRESIEQFRESSNEFFFRLRQLRFPNAWTGIAEGDSWFDYPPSWLEDEKRGDLINQLNQFSEPVRNERIFNILRIAQAGDTLENMVFGTDVNKDFLPEGSQFEKALNLVGKYQPNFFLFSGGGNDIAATELETFLNHSKSNLGLKRESHIDFVINQVFSEIFSYLIEKILEKKSDIHIFIHGYGHAIPDGRPVIKTEEYNFFGPWLRPTFAKKRINDLEESSEIIKDLIDAFNNMLNNLSQKNEFRNQVHYIDLRKIIKSDFSNYKEDWANELHLTVNGYEKVANKFAQVIRESLDKSPSTQTNGQLSEFNRN